MSEPIKTAVAGPALQLARGISVVGTVVSDFVVKEFVSKKGMPCRILKGMVSCGSGCYRLCPALSGQGRGRAGSPQGG